MPIPTLTPPANPVVIYSAPGTLPSTSTCTRADGVILATDTATPVKDCATALRTASVDLSTYVTLLSISDNPLWRGQLNDMPTTGVA
jgi:hypothetical protein